MDDLEIFSIIAIFGVIMAVYIMFIGPMGEIWVKSFQRQFFPAPPVDKAFDLSNMPSTNIITHISGNITEIEVSDLAYLTPTALKIATWNLQIFGDKKASDRETLLAYTQIMSQYDIVFIEEIRNLNGTAFADLCRSMRDYGCAISSPAGRSTSKEQYGIFYKNVGLVDTVDYNFKSGIDEDFERAPYLAKFQRGNYTFSIIVEHTKPDDTPNEMEHLDSIASAVPGNVMVLGDLNADCAYYPEKKDFNEPWFWAIKTGTDTTVGNTVCAYDRIILNGQMAKSFVDSGVFRTGIESNLSDHYLVWAEIYTS